jgi:hypothetical protein
MNRSHLLLVPLLLLSSPAYSQQSKNASYSCAVEWMGGGWYNSSTKRWQGNAFKPSSLGGYSTFVLTMKYSGTRPVMTFKKTENLDDYNVFITPSDSPFPRDCQGDNESGIVTMRLGSFRCSAAVSDYIFDQNTNRFLQISAVGYFTGQDSNDNIPFVAGGTCTKTGE